MSHLGSSFKKFRFDQFKSGGSPSTTAATLVKVVLATMLLLSLVVTLASGSMTMALTFFFGGSALLFLYFLPTLVALKRKKQNKAALIWLSILLGWTVVGWITALAWALTRDVVLKEPEDSAVRWTGKICHFCEEPSRRTALVCRYCGAAFVQS